MFMACMHACTYANRHVFSISIKWLQKELPISPVRMSSWLREGPVLTVAMSASLISRKSLLFIVFRANSYQMLWATSNRTYAAKIGMLFFIFARHCLTNFLPYKLCLHSHIGQDSWTRPRSTENQNIIILSAQACIDTISKLFYTENRPNG